MRKYIMFPHGGSSNHGCEAIVRTTCNMLGQEKTILFSSSKDEDYRYGLDKITEIAEPTIQINKRSLSFVKSYIKRTFLNQSDAIDALRYSPVISSLDRDSVLISIGGDNYCYGENEFIYMVNRYAKKKHAKTVLWGCSVEPKVISGQMSEDLQGYDLIVARESITYDTLKKINANTVFKPDPAFTMASVECALPPVFEKSKVIGINLSPLIILNEKNNGITFQNYVKLTDYILKNTSYSVALIPHVVWKTNDDRTILNELKAAFPETDRISLVEDHFAPELKYIISKCDLFVGARTHATIAAYSTCVPTLVVGYSVKAKGIAKDLFGDYNRYVLPVQGLEHEDDLINGFRYIFDNKDNIKGQLQQLMPSYIQSAASAGKLLTEGLQ